MEHIIGFLGGGNMAGAMIGGLLKTTDPARIRVADRHPEKLAHFAEAGVRTYKGPGDWVTECTLLVLAVKPQNMKEAVAPYVPFLNPEGCALSIAAGIEASALSAWLGGYRVLRAMPNTPALVGCGMTGFWAPEGTPAEMLAAAETVLKASGDVVRVPDENGIDLVGAIPGSGPAYVFRFMEALEAAGLKRGLDAEAARSLALGTVYGAAMLARSTDEPFSRLREKVTSKGGTTAKALEVMNARDVDGMMDEAIEAALKRTAEMKALFR